MAKPNKPETGTHKATHIVRVFGRDEQVCKAHLNEWRALAAAKGASLEVLGQEPTGNCSGSPKA